MPNPGEGSEVKYSAVPREMFKATLKARPFDSEEEAIDAVLKGRVKPAAAVRIAVGSATVAMTMAAGIIAAMPAVPTVCSHVNDSGFWLVKSLCNLDEKTTLKTWTIMETIVGLVGFLMALAISFFA